MMYDNISHASTISKGNNAVVWIPKMVYNGPYGCFVKTSIVIQHDKITGEFETLNSKYIPYLRLNK